MSVISDQPFFQEWKESEKHGLTHLILVTANRLRLGKTYAAMRIGEVLDPNFTIDNVGFDTAWYVEQADKSERGAILVLDEPNRAAGNRSWYTEENRGFAEYLQTNAYRGIHGLFPLPHQHLMDNAITGVCTSQIVMTGPGQGQVYLFERDQLNRSYTTYTPRWGDLLLKPPNTKLAHAYEIKRDAYTRAKNHEFIRKLKENTALSLQPGRADLVKQVLADPERFTDNGKLSANRIMDIFDISHNKAYEVRNKARARQKLSFSS